MAAIEDNKHNPTITKFKRKIPKNHFIIKYKTEDERNAYSQLIIRLSRDHELDDFHIEESLAYEESRVMYNYHTVLKEGEFSYSKLEHDFLRFYDS